MDNLLIICQDKKMRESLMAALEDKFMVLLAEGEMEALSVLKNRYLDLIILDIPLQDVDVSILLQEIKKIESECVIVALSNSEQKIPDELQDDGAYEIVIKPFRKKELLNVLKRAQEKGRLMTELKFLRSQAGRANIERHHTPFEKYPEAEDPARSYYYYQEAIRKFSKALTYAFAPSKLLDSVVTAIAEIFEINKVAILLKNEGGSKYKIKASTGLQEDITGRIELRAGEGIAGWLGREEQILRREDLYAGESFPGYIRIRKEMDMLGAFLCLPLSTRGDLIAVVSLGKKSTGNRFTYEDIKLLATMANYAAVSIYNSFLYREVSLQRNYQQIIMGNIPTGVITVDNEGKITMVNKAGRKILELGKAKIIGRGIQKAGSIVADIMLRTLNGETAYNRHEVTLPGKNICLGVSASLLKDEDEKIIGGLMVFTNLSKVKGLEEKIKKLEEEAMWKKLAEGIAHDVRNPLVSIGTFVQLFPEKYQDEEFRKDFYRIMARDVKKLDELTDKLERYAEPLSLNLQPVDLNLILEEILAGVKDKLKQQKISVKKNYSSGIHQITADRDQLIEAFSHMVDNSIQAMPDRGTLTISTEIEDEENKEVVLKFKDTGKGVSGQDMGKLFSPLFSTTLKGLGLGLPIAKKIIEGHGGRIEGNSIPGKETLFKVFLPVMPDTEKLKEKGINVRVYPEINSEE